MTGSLQKPSICALVCTRNGAGRLGPVLTALREQAQVDANALEIVVVDNGSSDETFTFAEATLSGARFTTRVMLEPRPGQMAAFRCGLSATTADIITTVDDDNILAPDFFATVLALFTDHPEVGVIGSHNVAVFPAGQSAPPWFTALAGKFACAPPGGFASPPRPLPLAIVPGAGCSLRRAPLEAALASGYSFINDTTREGRLWITGMDTEWCYLFAALGWKFLYDPRLRLEHVMTADRLKWEYARRLARTIGTSVTGIDPFIRFARDNTCNGSDRSATWQWQALAKLRRLARHGPALRKLPFPGKEGDLRVLEMEEDFGSLLRVLHERKNYTAHMERTRAFLRKITANPAGIVRPN